MLQPAGDRLGLPVQEPALWSNEFFHEASGVAKVSGLKGEFYRFGEQMVLLIPGAGPLETFPQCFCTQAAKCFGLHGFREEGMIAIPQLLSVERLKKETGALNGFQQAGTFPVLHHRVTQGCREPGEETGRQQESLERLWLSRKDLGDQIVQQLSPGAGENGSYLCQIPHRPGLRECQRQQAQTGNPSFQALLQPADHFRRKRSRAAVLEKLPGFLLGE